MIIRFIKTNFLKFVTFSLIGLSSALIHMLFFNLFRFWLGVSFVSALFLGVFISIIYNFSMNRNITFSARGYSIKKQMWRFLIIYAVSISVNFLVASTLENILGAGMLRENIAIIGGIAMSIPISFLGSLFWVFKKKNLRFYYNS